MQWYGLGIVVVGWLLVGMALAAEQRPLAVPSTVREAPRVFVRYCSACHGAHGRGDGPAAAALRPPPADLTRLAQRRDGLFPVAEVTAGIDGRTIMPAHGSREMPIWGERFGEMAGGGLTSEAVVHAVLRMLIDYLQAIQCSHHTGLLGPLHARETPGGWCQEHAVSGLWCLACVLG